MKQIYITSIFLSALTLTQCTNTQLPYIPVPSEITNRRSIYISQDYQELKTHIKLHPLDEGAREDRNTRCGSLDNDSINNYCFDQVCVTLDEQEKVSAITLQNWNYYQVKQSTLDSVVGVCLSIYGRDSVRYFDTPSEYGTSTGRWLSWKLHDNYLATLHYEYPFPNAERYCDRYNVQFLLVRDTAWYDKKLWDATKNYVDTHGIIRGIWLYEALYRALEKGNML